MLLKLLQSMPSEPVKKPEEDKSELCKVSGRPLEVVCVDCHERICTNCALFGAHKNHDIRSEEEICNETQVRAEYLMEMFELMETNFDSLTEKVSLLMFKLRIK